MPPQGTVGTSAGTGQAVVNPCSLALFFMCAVVNFGTWMNWEKGRKSLWDEAFRNLYLIVSHFKSSIKWKSNGLSHHGRK